MFPSPEFHVCVQSPKWAFKKWQTWFSTFLLIQTRRVPQLQVASLRFLLAVCLFMSASEDTAEKAAGTHGGRWGCHTTGSAANARDPDPAPGSSKCCFIYGFLPTIDARHGTSCIQKEISTTTTASSLFRTNTWYIGDVHLKIQQQAHVQLGRISVCEIRNEGFPFV